MHKLFAILLVLAATTAAAENTIFVDVTDARRGIFHTQLGLDAAPGPITLVYPKWIPGEHMPTGPITQMAGLRIRSGSGEVLEWSRDRVDMFAFHVTVPAGANRLLIEFDYMSPSSTFGGGYGESANATQHLALVLFNHLVLYPAGPPSDNITFRAAVRLPAMCKFAT